MCKFKHGMGLSKGEDYATFEPGKKPNLFLASSTQFCLVSREEVWPNEGFQSVSFTAEDL